MKRTAITTYVMVTYIYVRAVHANSLIVDPPWGTLRTSDESEVSGGLRGLGEVREARKSERRKMSVTDSQ